MSLDFPDILMVNWIPACAGMTMVFLLLRIQILSRYPGGSRGPMVRPYSLLSVVSDLMLATKGMNRYTLI